MKSRCSTRTRRETDAVQGPTTVEYIEYYRIIRERVWLVILGAVLAGLVVVGLHFVVGTTEVSTARGSLSANDVAMRAMMVQSDQLLIGVDEGFWASAIQRGTGPTALSAILQELKLTSDAEEEYKISIGAGQLEGSNVVSLTCSSYDRDLALKAVEVGMKLWDTRWREYKIEEANRAIDILEKRLPTLEAELDDAQAVVDAIEARHGGVAPVKEADTLASSLTATQIAMQSASLESAAAEERSKALATQPQRTASSAAERNPALLERIDVLNQQLMDREVLLADMLGRRTKEHPSVKALEQQIADLKKRLNTLEIAAAAESSSGYVQEAVIAARTYAMEMSARRELLAAREAEIRGKLSKVRTDIVEHEKASSNVTALQKRCFDLREAIRSAHAELLARQNVKHMLKVEDEAKLDRQPRGFMKLVVKLGLAGMGGVGVGILVIFVLHYIDTTFKNEEDAARMLGYPVLGGIPHSDVEVIETEADDTTPEENKPQGAGYSSRS